MMKYRHLLCREACEKATPDDATIHWNNMYFGASSLLVPRSYVLNLSVISRQYAGIARISCGSFHAVSTYALYLPVALLWISYILTRHSQRSSLSPHLILLSTAFHTKSPQAQLVFVAVQLSFLLPEQNGWKFSML